MKLKQASKEFYKEFHCEKIRAWLAKMFFYVLNATSQSSQWSKASSVQNGFHEWNIVFSDQICTE